MPENSFYYDGSLCIACRGCQVACKQWNNLPGEKTTFFAAPGGYQNPADLSTITWNLIKFHEVETGDKVEWFFRRHHCFHCTDANCIEACPVEPTKAMMRNPHTGTVMVNQERCIGCGACEDACPYGVPHIDEDAEKSRKCTGCVDRVANNLEPACSKNCPTDAITYGSKDAMYEKAKKRVKELKKLGFKKANVYGTKQLGGLHSIYVLPGAFEVYGLPKDPEFGSNIEAAKQKGREKFAAVQGKPKVNLAGGGAIAMTGLVAAGLKKLADRKAENREDN
jgi:formate dehydrogenase iron-sulfur subunit